MNNNKNRTHSGNNECFIGIELESLENAEKKMFDEKCRQVSQLWRD